MDTGPYVHHWQQRHRLTLTFWRAVRFPIAILPNDGRVRPRKSGRFRPSV